MPEIMFKHWHNILYLAIFSICSCMSQSNGFVAPRPHQKFSTQLSAQNAYAKDLLKELDEDVIVWPWQHDESAAVVNKKNDEVPGFYLLGIVGSTLLTKLPDIREYPRDIFEALSNSTLFLFLGTLSALLFFTTNLGNAMKGSSLPQIVFALVIGLMGVSGSFIVGITLALVNAMVGLINTPIAIWSSWFQGKIWDNVNREWAHISLGDQVDTGLTSSLKNFIARLDSEKKEDLLSYVYCIRSLAPVVDNIITDAGAIDLREYIQEFVNEEISAEDFKESCDSHADKYASTAYDKLTLLVIGTAFSKKWALADLRSSPVRWPLYLFNSALNNSSQLQSNVKKLNMAKEWASMIFKEDPNEPKTKDIFFSRGISLVLALYLDHVSALAEDIYFKVLNDGSNMSPLERSRRAEALKILGQSYLLGLTTQGERSVDDALAKLLEEDINLRVQKNGEEKLAELDKEMRNAGLFEQFGLNKKKESAD